MSQVFVDVNVSLDGYMAPEETDDSAHLEQWWEDWMEIVGWVPQQRFFRENLQLGEGGETGQENDLLEEVFERTGVSIMGMNMFRRGETGWPEEAPFHTPVYVLTHEVREPWERPGGTVFHFVNDGIHAALDQAREAASDRDVRIAGGVQAVQQYLNAGLVDELTLHISPNLLGRGLRLFDGVDRDRFSLVAAHVQHAPAVTHITYKVNNLVEDA